MNPIEERKGPGEVPGNPGTFQLRITGDTNELLKKSRDEVKDLIKDQMREAYKPGTTFYTQVRAAVVSEFRRQNVPEEYMTEEVILENVQSNLEHQIDLQAESLVGGVIKNLRQAAFNDKFEKDFGHLDSEEKALAKQSLLKMIHVQQKTANDIYDEFGGKISFETAQKIAEQTQSVKDQFSGTLEVIKNSESIKLSQEMERVQEGIERMLSMLPLPPQIKDEILKGYPQIIADVNKLYSESKISLEKAHELANQKIQELMQNIFRRGL